MADNLEKLTARLVSNVTKKNISNYEINKSGYNKLIKSTKALGKIIDYWGLDYDVDIDQEKMQIDIVIHFEVIDEEVHENGFLDIFDNCVEFDIKPDKNGHIMKFVYGGIWEEI